MNKWMMRPIEKEIIFRDYIRSFPHLSIENFFSVISQMEYPQRKMMIEEIETELMILKGD